MNPETLITQIETSLQIAADILGVTYATATLEEQDLIIDLSTVKQHHLEWYLAITPNNQITTRAY